jgi:hypothetical protein
MPRVATGWINDSVSLYCVRLMRQLRSLLDQNIFPAWRTGK